MKFALENPNLVDRLIIADVAPYSQIPSQTLLSYVKFMKAIDLGKVQSRRDADEQLRQNLNVRVHFPCDNI